MLDIPLYEHPVWQGSPDQLMRPGGVSITEQALSYCDLQPGPRMLDLGCGMGTTLKHLATGYEFTGIGIDLSRALLSYAHRGGPKASYAQARSEFLPFANESMDVILSECTLSIFETDLVLRECMRLLRPGGYLIVNDLYARNEIGISALRQLPPGTCIGTAIAQVEILERIQRCGLELMIWQDCSEKLRQFPICTLSTAANVDSFDLYLAAARAKLGYYFLVARKQV